MGDILGKKYLARIGKSVNVAKITSTSIPEYVFFYIFLYSCLRCHDVLLLLPLIRSTTTDNPTTTSFAVILLKSRISQID